MIVGCLVDVEEVHLGGVVEEDHLATEMVDRLGHVEEGDHLGVVDHDHLAVVLGDHPVVAAGSRLSQAA